jgi:hypothetical protein
LVLKCWPSWSSVTFGPTFLERLTSTRCVNAPLAPPPLRAPEGVGQAVGRAVALPPPGARSFTLAPPHPAIPARSLNPFLHPCARPPARPPPPLCSLSPAPTLPRTFALARPPPPCPPVHHESETSPRGVASGDPPAGAGGVVGKARDLSFIQSRGAQDGVEDVSQRRESDR